MKKDYTEKLRCATCGSDSHFEFNEDKSFIKCTNCNREYAGGYDELVQLNQELIEKVKQEMIKDTKDQIVEQLKKSFKGNKNIKFK
jgi:ribosomal protein L37AE/L43A